MQDYTKLRVWIRARELTIRVHTLTRETDLSSFPGFRTQSVRACAAIAANIAEGAGQVSPAQFARFLAIAIGSTSELESHLSIGEAVGLIAPAPAQDLIAETIAIRKMLHGLRKRVLGQ